MIVIYKHTLNGKSYIGQTGKPLSWRIGKDFSDGFRRACCSKRFRTVTDVSIHGGH